MAIGWVGVHGLGAIVHAFGATAVNKSAALHASMKLKEPPNEWPVAYTRLWSMFRCVSSSLKISLVTWTSESCGVRPDGITMMKPASSALAAKPPVRVGVDEPPTQNM